MATGDFQDLYTDACYASRRDPTDTTLDVPRAKKAVNWVYLHVCDSGDDWDWLEREGQFTLTAGADTYTFASVAAAIGLTAGAGIAEVYELVLDTPGIGLPPLERVHWDDLERLTRSSQDGDSKGVPRYFADWNGRLRLAPAPDSNYSVGCLVRMRPAELTANSDEPLVPLAWRRRILVPGAAELLLREEGGGEAVSEADRYKVLFDQAFLEFRAAHAGARGTSVRLVDPSWSAGVGVDDLGIW